MRRGRRRAKRARVLAEELHKPLDEETEEIQEGERAFNEEFNDEPRPATEDEFADEVSTIWRQRFTDDPKGALNDLRAMVKELGYELAYAGHTFRAPVTERTYYIINADGRERIAPFQDGRVDLTLLDVCLWSERRSRGGRTPDGRGLGRLW
jgi:hypothetical protein